MRPQNRGSIMSKHVSDEMEQGQGTKSDSQLSQKIEEFTQYLSRNPSDEKAWEQLGMAYLELSDITNAIRCFDQVLNTNPENNYALVAKGYLLLAKGEFDKAIEYFKKAIEHNRRNKKAWEGLAFTQILIEDTRSAINSYSAYLTLAPNNGLAWYHIAIAYAFEGLYEEAIFALETAMTIDPSLSEDILELLEIINSQIGLGNYEISDEELVDGS